MKAYIWVTFALLGWAYYELSGGGDFAPGPHGVSVFAEVAEMAPDEAAVSRLAVVDMTSVGPVEGATRRPSDQAEVEAAVLAALRSTAPAMPAESPVTMVVPADETEASAEGAVASAPAVDLRAVNGSGVNLRSGPGQDHPVLTRLARGTTVQVLEDPGTGWVRLQVVPQGRIGWMADYLLDAS
ncbi:MAG: SH3 domain-containing protein [Rhodobacteraceae bacterium]|nr:MAG: SH3 domain-containing protein [Paracoccaceae bacterium]